ncbi:MAG: hypothetical protein LBU35_00695 [Holosporales bacterium]|jgi:hypothetical protein|nr:hypothetical protein [Holosporales bacterium]
MRLKSSISCIFRISIFLGLVVTLVIFLFDVLKSAFIYNAQINSIIILSLFLGILLVYRNLCLYLGEYSLLYKLDELSAKDVSKLKVIKPITLYITKTNKLISQSKLQTIMAGIEKKIDDYASFPRYISGILIFLGLLGTFWGLSHTIGNVANIIDNLGIEQSDAAESFLKLKNSLKIPLSGMGIAFGCSLLGLSSSLILGFLTINQKRAADDFIDKIEEWITKHTISFDSIDSQPEFHGSVFSMGLLEKTIETMYAFQNQLKDLDGNRATLFNMQKEVSGKISKLTEALTFHQDVIKALGKNQLELQTVTMNISQKMTDGVWKEMAEKLTSIDAALNSMAQESISGKKYIVDTLSSDIRMISKTLSMLMRE